VRYATPVFDGCTLTQLHGELERAGLPVSGKAKVYDGRTGLELDNPLPWDTST